MKTYQTVKKYLPAIVSYVICTVLLIIPAIWNGYPLVYSDTGTYLIAAPWHTVPVDRPIGYSIFVQFFSFGYSLWFIVIFHALIITFLTDLALKEVLVARNRKVWLVVIIAFLVITTGIDNYVSQIMPDILMPIMILSVALLFIRKKSWDEISFLLLALFAISSVSHYTILVAVTGFLGLSFLVWVVFLRKNKFLFSKLKAFSIWCVLVWLLAPSINAFYKQGFTLSRAKYVIFASRFIEEGILQDFLAENCATNEYFLCPYKYSIPKNCIEFMWGNSALYKDDCINDGWGNCWVTHDKELGKMVKDMLVQPKYFKRFISMAGSSTFKQLANFDIGMLVPMHEGSPPYTGVESIYKHELKQYMASRQYQNTLYYAISSKVQFYTVLLSCIALILYFAASLVAHKQFSSIFSFSIIIITFVIFNAAICGTLSMVTDRYQSRVIWFVPFMALIAGIAYFSKKKQPYNS